MLHPSDENDRHSLRRSLFGGEPHLSFCTDPKIPNLDDFVTKVRQGLGDSRTQFVVRTAIVECDEILSSGEATSLRKALKLKDSQPGEPTILWSVNGEKPQQLAMSVYTSEIKEPPPPPPSKKKHAATDKSEHQEKKEGKEKGKKGKGDDAGKKGKGKGKGKEKDPGRKEKGGGGGGGGGGGVKVELNATKLSEFVLKHRTPKLGSLTSAPAFKKQCLGRKYQVCGLISHQGGELTPTERKKWLKTASQHRSVRFFTVDTSQHKVVGVHEERHGGEEPSGVVQLTLFRRDNYVYSGPPLQTAMDEDVVAALSAAQRKWEDTNRALALPVEVESMGPRVRVSLALRNVQQKARALAPRAEQLVEFRKGELELELGGVDAVNLEERKEDVVVLIREGSVAYFLDWESAASHLLRRSAFDEVFDEDRMGKLQFQTLTGGGRRGGRASSSSSSKPQSTKYLHYPGDTSNSTALAAFLKLSVLDEMPMSSVHKEPTLLKRTPPRVSRHSSTTSTQPSGSSTRTQPKKPRGDGTRTSGGGKGQRQKQEEVVDSDDDDDDMLLAPDDDEDDILDLDNF
jgi:hypothetical protein